MNKTDAILKKLEKQIKEEYSKAYREVRAEAMALQTMIDSIGEADPKKRLLLLQKQRLDTISAQMAEIEYHAGEVAQRMIEDAMVNVYSINYNQDASQLGFALIDNSAVRKVLTQQENPFIKISSLHDKVAIRDKMKSELMTALLKGESIQKMARRFKNVGEGYLKNAVRIARTETTRVQNSAKMDVGEKGKELGFVMRKRWVSTYDGRTRDEHLAMDGVEIDTDEPFILPDGTRMMFPGDISMGADAGQVINCRCTMVEFILRDDEGNLVTRE